MRDKISLIKKSKRKVKMKQRNLILKSLEIWFPPYNPFYCLEHVQSMDAITNGMGLMFM